MTCSRGRLTAGSGCWRRAEGPGHLLAGDDYIPGQHQCSHWRHPRKSVFLPEPCATPKAQIWVPQRALFPRHT